MNDLVTEVRAVVAAARDWDGEVDDARIDAILTGLCGSSLDDAIVSVLARGFQLLHDANEMDERALADAARACYDMRSIFRLIGDAFEGRAASLWATEKLCDGVLDLTTAFARARSGAVEPVYSEADYAESEQRYRACARSIHELQQRAG